MTGEIVKKVTENVTITAIARISMALSMPTFGLVAWLGVYWIESKIKDEVNTLRLETNSRLISIEIQQESAEKLADKFQTATLKKLDDVEDAVIKLSNVVSALTSTVNNVVEDRREDMQRR